MTDTKLILVSHHLCPYVQRAAITLAEKGVSFARRFIDLAAKPDWFTALSPLGKVPLLLIERPDRSRAVLFESAVICEYLEDTLTEIPLHPSDPLVKAQHRGWIEFGSSILADLWGFETARTADLFETKRATMIEKFARVEDALGPGPYFGGGRLGLVDAAYAPIFRYFEVFDAMAPTGVLDDCPRVRDWRTALAARRSVRDAVEPDYAIRLRAFLQRHDAWLLKRAA